MLPSIVVPSGSLIHRDRYSTTGVVARKGLVVVHDSESGDDSHNSLLTALSRPGDRLIAGSDPPRYYGSGYHAITNGKGGYTLLLGALGGPYAAPPRNKDAWHVCMPGRAMQVSEEWQDVLSANHIRGVAQFIVDSGVEPRYLTAADLRAGIVDGYTSHWQVSLAWGQTNHWDPGPNFPWEVLDDEIRLLAAPEVPAQPVLEDDDMPNPAIAAIYEPDGEVASSVPNAKWFLLKADGGIRHATNPDVAYAVANEVPFYKNNSYEQYKSLEAASQRG